MLPSRRLIIMALGSAPLLLAGAAFEPLTVFGIAYVALLIAYAAVDALLLPSRRRIAVTRIVPERVSLGTPTAVTYEVNNRTRRNVEVRLAEDLPEDLDADPPECGGVFPPGSWGMLSHRLTARRRGRYSLSGLDVRVLPALGLFYRQFRLEMPAEVHAFPNLLNLKRYELLVRRGLTREQGVARQRQIGQGSEFESLRQYSAGDEMSRVDWKATAKRSRLIVRNYEPERHQSVLVAIDAGRATAGEFEGLSRLDYLVNAALMLAYVALRQGDWFSLVAFSDRIESYLPPVRQLRNIDRVARTLYELEARLVEADYAAACRFLSLKNRKRSLVCLMTDVLDREASGIIIDYLARFAHHHLPLAVTLANPEVQALADAPLGQTPDPYAKAAALDVLAAREEALAAMRHRGIGVLDAAPHALMPALINRYLSIKSTGRL